MHSRSAPPLGGAEEIELLGACAPERHQLTGLGCLNTQGGNLDVKVHPGVIAI
jgi:hypothetical protein